MYIDSIHITKHISPTTHYTYIYIYTHTHFTHYKYIEIIYIYIYIVCKLLNTYISYSTLYEVLANKQRSKQ